MSIWEWLHQTFFTKLVFTPVKDARLIRGLQGHAGLFPFSSTPTCLLDRHGYTPIVGQRKITKTMCGFTSHFFSTVFLLFLHLDLMILGCQGSSFRYRKNFHLGFLPSEFGMSSATPSRARKVEVNLSYVNAPYCVSVIRPVPTILKTLRHSVCACCLRILVISPWCLFIGIITS